MTERRGPVTIELDAPGLSPAEAPPVPDAAPQGQAMQQVAALATRRSSFLGRWAWRLGLSIVVFAAGIWAWNFVLGLAAANPVLGAVAAVLIVAFLLVMAAIAVRELAAFARLGRIDTIHRAAAQALVDGDATAAREAAAKVARLYAGRAEVKLGREAYAAREEEVFDADAILALAEQEMLPALDALARREVEAASRQVATVTAVVPLALADLAAALVSNIRMIRRIAEIYGGRSGTLGSWRLTRAVFAHLIATGAVAVGDDLIGSLAGGGVLAKVSRRFGEGVVNGALTARVGVAAIEVCRPLPFMVLRKPRVTNLVQRALTGLFPGGN